MKWQAKRSISRWVMAACGLVLAGAPAMAQYTGPAVTPETPAAGAPASAMSAHYGEVKIVPGDTVAIETYGAPELTIGASGGQSGIKVGSQGEVVLPYLGTIRLGGLTPSEASLYLERQLKEKGILVDPQVSVELVNSPTQIISVLGEVQKPQPVPAYGELRLLEVISACGGLTPLASHTITIRRVGDPNPITVELGTDPKTTDESNIPLMPGDTVIVPKVGSAYIVGEVKTPEAIPLASNTPITVMRAISISGGLKYGAALSKAMIVRTTPDHQRVEIMLDLKKVQEGKQKDVALVTDDILYVPTNGFKAAISTGGAANSAVYAAVELGYIFH